MSIISPLVKAAGHFAMATVEGALSEDNMKNVLEVAYRHEGQSLSTVAKPTLGQDLAL